jgi:amino acid transporter
MELITTIILLISGIMVSIGGCFYLIKSRGDKDSVKIYTITIIVCLVITIIAILKLLMK